MQKVRDGKSIHKAFNKAHLQVGLDQIVWADHQSVSGIKTFYSVYVALNVRLFSSFLSCRTLFRSPSPDFPKNNVIDV